MSAGNVTAILVMTVTLKHVLDSFCCGNKQAPNLRANSGSYFSLMLNEDCRLAVALVQAVGWWSLLHLFSQSRIQAGGAAPISYLLFLRGMGWRGRSERTSQIWHIPWLEQIRRPCCTSMGKECVIFFGVRRKGILGTIVQSAINICVYVCSKLSKSKEKKSRRCRL